MLKADAIKHYKTSYKLAQAIGISPSAVYQWGTLVPPPSAIKIEIHTQGKIKVNPHLYTQDRSDEAKKKRSGRARLEKSRGTKR